jgi:hypothetical protein
MLAGSENGGFAWQEKLQLRGRLSGTGLSLRVEMTRCRSSSMAGVLPFDDWLLLTENSADGGLHFIGTFDRRITFYSQQVRALRVVHALSRPGKLKSTDYIAVVGAGAAGATAALGLALLGNDVTLYDPAGSILQLQSASPRLLHPHIYEWPRLGSLDSRAGLPILDWSANNGGGLRSASGGLPSRENAPAKFRFQTRP